MFIENDPQTTIQAPSGAALFVVQCAAATVMATSLSMPLLTELVSSERTVSAIDMALLTELCPRAAKSWRDRIVGRRHDRFGLHQ